MSQWQKKTDYFAQPSRAAYKEQTAPTVGNKATGRLTSLFLSLRRTPQPNHTIYIYECVCVHIKQDTTEGGNEKMRSKGKKNTRREPIFLPGLCVCKPLLYH